MTDYDKFSFFKVVIILYGCQKKDLRALGKFNFRCIRDTATRYHLSLHIRQTDINSSLRFIHTCLCLFYSTFEHSKVRKSIIRLAYNN